MLDLVVALTDLDPAQQPTRSHVVGPCFDYQVVTDRVIIPVATECLGYTYRAVTSSERSNFVSMAQMQ